MKSIKIYLLPIILVTFFTTQGLSQNAINNGVNENEKISRTDSILVHGYFTEFDFNEINGISNSKENVDSEFYYGEETLKEEELRKRERDSFLNEVAAEVIVEVVVNAVFILATFWQ